MRKLFWLFPFLTMFFSAFPTVDASADQRYDRPRIDGYRLDWCREWAQNCGRPAADAFCRRQGHPGVSDFRKENNVGAYDATRVISSGQICGDNGCDGFRYVTCQTVRQRGARYDRPRINGYRLDWCREWAQNCGKPAADAFCRARGFRRSDGFSKDNDVGGYDPTQIITSGQICADSGCDSFGHIQCVGRRGGGGGNQGARAFDRPRINGYRLDWCREWGQNCGRPAARAFCRAKGFRRVMSFDKANNIGDRTPTQIITSGQICGDRGCDGFRRIVCGR